MGVFRDYMLEASDQLLDVLWDEIELWEKTGALPMSADLREVTRRAFPTVKKDPHSALGTGYFSDDDPGKNGMMVQSCSTEVWREIARRARQSEVVDLSSLASDFLVAYEREFSARVPLPPNPTKEP